MASLITPKCKASKTLKQLCKKKKGNEVKQILCIHPKTQKSKYALNYLLCGTFI